MSLGRNIRLVRTARGLALSELAGEAGISSSYLSLIESDRRHPSLRVLRLLAERLRVPTSVLLWETGPSEGSAAEGSEHLQGLMAVLYRILQEVEAAQT
jgi:transcriptional regulator with XRE-family HTH domain